MKKLVVVQKLRNDAYAALEGRPDVDWRQVEDVSPGNLSASIRDAMAITVRVAPLPESVLDAAPDLRVISRHGVGYDNIPVEYCTRRGIAVAITGNANSVSVAEHAMFLALAAARVGVVMDSAVRSGNFAARSEMTGLELRGRTLLIVGFGRIGRELARRASAFGMRILAYDPYLRGTPPHDVEMVADFPASLPRVDVLSLHVPLTPETRHLVGAAEIDLLRDRAIVVNAGRGGLVDEAALLDRVRSGKLQGAGLDTFEREPLPPDSPLTDEQRIVLSPHSAALTEESLSAMGRLTIKHALDGLDGKLDPSTLVNPEILG